MRICDGCPYPTDCAEIDECVLGSGQGVCNNCGGILRLNYGFAGGEGIGAYLFCDKCSLITDKWPDPEMQ